MMDRFFMVVCMCSWVCWLLLSWVNSCWFWVLVVMFMCVCSRVLVCEMCCDSLVRCWVVVLIVVIVGDSCCCMNLFSVCVLVILFLWSLLMCVVMMVW